MNNPLNEYQIGDLVDVNDSIGKVLEANEKSIKVTFNFGDGTNPKNLEDIEISDSKNVMLVLTKAHLDEARAKFLEKHPEKYKIGDLVKIINTSDETDGAMGKVYFVNDSLTCVDFKGDKGLNNIIFKTEDLQMLEFVESTKRKEEYELDRPVFYFLMTLAVYCFVRLIIGFLSIAAASGTNYVHLSQAQEDEQAAWFIVHIILWFATMGGLFGYESHYSNKKFGADGIRLEKWICQICGQEADRPMSICDEHAIAELCKRTGVHYSTIQNTCITQYILAPTVTENGKQVYTGKYYFNSEQDCDRINGAFVFLEKNMKNQLEPIRYRIASWTAMAMSGIGLLFVAFLIYGYLSSVEFERKQAEEQARRDREERHRAMFEDKGGMNKYGYKPW